MYARSTTIQAEPGRIDDGITFIRDEVMPMLTKIEGCVGLSMMVDRTSGRCITTSAWRDEAALTNSDAQVRPLRARAAEIFGAQPEVESWEIAVLHRTDDAPDGACVRATWTRTDTGKIQQAVDMYRSTLLPQMEELAGFCSSSLFINRETGKAVSSVTYASREALEQSRDRATSMRRTAVQENDIEVLHVAEFDLVVAHLRVPETV